ncbi:hypothetical protein [Streptomyces sp. L2]|uniref:hypothetical protein n=1 Tax=Streptomyces sp. L2 TaxID=2162665 RepID=UPI001011E805|nr:hypothetical protein [Streptomyces sp. L2]
MASSPINNVDPFVAVERLRTALDQAGIVLPSLAVDAASPSLRLVELGRVRSDIALRLADALQQRAETPA